METGKRGKGKKGKKLKKNERLAGEIRSVNECMNSYTDKGRAHVELLLVTCLRKESPPGNRNLLLLVYLLQYSL